MSYTDFIFDGHHRRQAEMTARANPYVAGGGIAYIEGEYVPINEARIPLLDQGFLHSDMTYDVPAIWDGRFFRLDDHLDRFWRSMDILRLNSPMSKDQMRDTLVEMAIRSGIRDAFVQLIVTRGLKFVRSVPIEQCESRVYLMVMPFVWVMPEPILKTGGSAIIARTVRRVPPGAIDPTVKNLQWGDLIRGIMEAQDRGATYPFLSDGDGNLTEGAGFNIMLVKDGVLYTPDRGVLHGVTRKTVMEVAEKLGIPTRMEVVPVEMAYHCDELLMVTTAGGVMPITRLDGAPVGNGEVGEISKALFKGYWEAHYDPALTFAIPYEEAPGIAAE